VLSAATRARMGRGDGQGRFEGLRGDARARAGASTGCPAGGRARCALLRCPLGNLGWSVRGCDADRAQLSVSGQGRPIPGIWECAAAGGCRMRGCDRKPRRSCVDGVGLLSMEGPTFWKGAALMLPADRGGPMPGIGEYARGLMGICPRANSRNNGIWPWLHPIAMLDRRNHVRAQG